jgi:hypothetical protein
MEGRMSISYTITDNVSPTLNNLIEGLTNRKGLNSTVGVGVAVLFRKHFITMNQERPNKRGFPRRNFWSKFKNVAHSADNDGATIAIPDNQGALRHHYYGGEVKPKRGKFLAIPLSGKAYKSKARMRDSFPNAFVFVSKKGNLLLAETNGKGKRKKMTLLALLLSSVMHKGDVTVLPQTTDVEKEIGLRAGNYIGRILQRRSRTA